MERLPMISGHEGKDKKTKRGKARTAVRTRDLAQFRWVPKARIIPLDHPGLDTISIAGKL